MEATFELPSSKAYNMVLLGALLKVRNLVPVEAVMKGLKKLFPNATTICFQSTRRPFSKVWNCRKQTETDNN